jgi:hypothetical protein
MYGVLLLLNDLTLADEPIDVILGCVAKKLYVESIYYRNTYYPLY